MNKVQGWLYRRWAVPVVSGLLILASFASSRIWENQLWGDILMVAAAVIAGTPVVIKAWNALTAKVIGIDLLVSVAAIGAVIIGNYWEAAAVTFLFAIGHALEDATLNRTRSALAELVAVAPDVAIVLRDEGSIENVLVENLVIETRLLHPDWWGAAEPIYVSARPRQPGGRLGTVRGLRFRQILARGEGGVFIEGTPGHEVEDMLLDGVSVDWKQSSGQTSGRIDVRPPESVGTTIEPVAGFRIRSARDVRVRDAAVRWISPRPAGATAVDASGVGVKFDDVRESQAPPEVERSAFVRPVGAPMR